MRDFCDAIFQVIGAASLSDTEFQTITVTTDPGVYTIDLYNALLAVLDSRELISNTRDRLRYFFLAKDVEVETTSPGKSNIFVGSVL